MKTLKLAVVMDPIEQIHPKKDTTLALLLAAQQRHCEIYYLEIKDLLLQDDNAFGFAKKLHVQNDVHHWFNIERSEILPLDFFDIILMRKDPPVDQAYLHATQILDFAEKKGVHVYNTPQSLRDYNEKLIIHHFAHLSPPTLVSADITYLKKFVNEQRDVICKPLDGMGGTHIFKATARDPNLTVILEMLTQRGQIHIMCQRYIPEISLGDKRILLVNGKPIPFALARIPLEGEVRGNLASGGIGQGLKLSAQDFKLCEEIGPFLKEKGLFLVGLDVIGSYVTEINITSPTCVREIAAYAQYDVAGEIIEQLFQLTT